jgi:hypothetical protein
MSMEPVHLRCSVCEATLTLAPALLERLEGRSGRVSCRSCDATIRLAHQAGELEVLGASVLESAPTDDQGAQRSGSALPPPLPPEALRPSTTRPPHSVEVGTLSPHTLAFGGAERDELPPPPSSPFPSSLADSTAPESLEELYEQVSIPRSSRSLYEAPLPPGVRLRDEPAAAAPTLSRKPSIAPPPPRPWELSRAPSLPPPPTSPFEDAFGLSVPPPMPEMVRLTADGRLVNAADDGTLERRSRRRRTGAWLAAAAAVLAVTGSAAARPDVTLELASAALGALRPAPSAPTLGKLAEVLVRPAGSAPVSTETGDATDAALPTDGALQSASLGARAATPEVRQPATSALGATARSAAPSSAPQAASAAAESTPSESDAPAEPAGAAAEDGAPALVGAGFDRAAAAAALNEATALAATCRGAEDPTGIAKVVVSFAPSGRATRALVSGPPFAGTPVGGCIASKFRAAQVPAFDGELVTVTKTVVVR